jgi:hypothetical protein
MPSSGITGSYGSSRFSFWGTCILLSIVFTLIYIPTKSREVFLFPPHPRQHLLLFVLLMITILTGVRWNLNVIFDLHFLYGQGCWTFLHIFIFHFYFSFWELSVQFICPFIQWVVWFFKRLVFWALHIFWLLIPCQM